MMSTRCALRNWNRSAPLPPIRKSSPAPPFSTSLAEMVEYGLTGLHVSPGDPRALAETICAAAKDSAGRVRMAATLRVRRRGDA